MTADDILKIIQQYGFPAAMCLWFMWRLENKLDAIQKINHQQVVIMAVLTRILGDRKALGAIPEDYFDSITGVTEIPFPEKPEKSSERKPT